jgi:phage N-6-adenine-methyltransferase
MTMRKKPEWESCGGLVVCTACGSDEMEMCDVRVRSGVRKRETHCIGCGDRRTTPITAPELPAAAAPSSAAETHEARTWVLDVPASLACCPECKKDTMEVLGRTNRKGSYRWHLRCTACGVARYELTERTSSLATAPTIELLALDAFRPESVQPRCQMDMYAYGDYARDMFVGEGGHIVNDRGEAWPPLVGFREAAGGKVWLADGFHRRRAAMSADPVVTAFQVEVHAGGARDALLFAVSANTRNGVRFGNADKRRAVSLLFDDVVLSKKTDTEIAALCRVSQPFVSKMRQERRERDMPAEQVKREDEEGRERPERSDNGYGEEGEPAPLQFDIEETIAAKQRRLAEEEEAAAERRAEAEEKRREQEQRDSWSTPPEFLESIVRPILETIDLDAASNEAAQAVVQATRWFSAEDDALAQEWAGNVWLNPPYSHPLVERFALKAIEEVKSGRVTQLLVLVNSSTSSVWWHELAKACTVVAFPLGRISFWSPHGLEGEANRSPSTLFYFGPHDITVRALLRSAGYFAALNTDF